MTSDRPGRKLVRELPAGTRIELANEGGASKVHWVWEDADGKRICRPSMLDSTLDARPDIPSKWRVFSGSESEFRRRECRDCRELSGGWPGE